MESSFEVSEPETQFVPQEDDEETLWKVIEIVQEDRTRKRYKVKWEGVDPSNGKPWTPSWVHMHDCTPDLVEAWLEKKALKAKRRSSVVSNASKTDRKAYKPSSHRESKVSLSSKISPAKSTSTNRSPRRNTRSSTPKPLKVDDTAHDVWDESPKAGPSNLNRNGKRKHDPVEDDVSDHERARPRGSTSSSRPTKKRKVISESDVESEEEVRKPATKPTIPQKKTTVQKPVTKPTSPQKKTTVQKTNAGSTSKLTPSKPVNGRRPSKFVLTDSESEGEAREKETEKVSTGARRPVVLIDSLPKPKASSSKSLGSNATAAAKKSSHVSFGNTEMTSDDEPPFDEENAPALVKPTTTAKLKPPSEQSKLKMTSTTQRVVRKKPSTPEAEQSPEIEDGWGDQEIGEIDYDIYPEPLEPVPERVDVDASGEDDLGDEEIPILVAGRTAEVSEEEVEDSERQNPPSDREEVDVETEFDEEEEEESLSNKRSSKPMDSHSEPSPEVHRAESHNTSEADERHAFVASAPTPAPAPVIPSKSIRHQSSDSADSRSRPTPRIIVNATAGPSRTAPNSEVTINGVTSKVGPPRKSNSKSDVQGFSKVEPVKRLPKVTAPTTPPRTIETQSRSPLLSPNAWKRLEEFDAFIASLPPDPEPLALPERAPVNGVSDEVNEPPQSPALPRPQNNGKARDKIPPPTRSSRSPPQAQQSPVSSRSQINTKTSDNTKSRDEIHPPTRSSRSPAQAEQFLISPRPQVNDKAREKTPPPTRPSRSPPQAQVTDKPPYNGTISEPDSPSHQTPQSSPRPEILPTTIPSSSRGPSLISKMKPRSPSKLASSSSSHRHPQLAPIVQMTPIRMNAMYASVGQSLFERQDSTIQQFSDVTEPSASQIEQFESPEKQQVVTPQNGGGLSGLHLEMTGTKRSNPFSSPGLPVISEADVRQRGEALADKHWRQLLLERNGGEVQKRKTIEDIQAERLGKQKTVAFVETAPLTEDSQTEPQDEQEDEDDEDDDEYNDLQEDDRQGYHAFPQPAQAQEASQEDSQVEDDEGEPNERRRQGHHAFSQPTQAQEASQESSQVEDDEDEPDERRIHHPFSQPTQAPQQQQASQESHQTDDQMDVDAEDIDGSLQYPPEDEPSLSQPALPAPGMQDESVMVIPATASDRHDTPPPSSNPMEDQIRRDPNVDAAMLELLNTKSEEISRLENSLADERDNGQSLMREIDSLKANGNSRVADLQHQLEELRTALTEANAAKEAAEQAKVALEKDKEIILEQYRKASEFAMTVQKEKVEAEQRAEIAETQVKEAVPLIKRTYETRVQVLEAEARKWQQISRFTVEREMRTNDEIRRRAAEEPELRRKIEELKAELENADLQWEESQKENRQLKMDRRQLEVEVAMWKEEVEKVKLERDANIGRVGLGSGESDQGFSEKDLVYYCRWKTEEGLRSCAEPFKTRTDLDNHIRLLGHDM